jgi:hypothetical protein
MDSFLKRAKASSLNMTIAGLFLWTLMPIRLQGAKGDLKN